MDFLQIFSNFGLQLSSTTRMFGDFQLELQFSLRGMAIAQLQFSQSSIPLNWMRNHLVGSNICYQQEDWSIFRMNKYLSYLPSQSELNFLFISLGQEYDDCIYFTRYCMSRWRFQEESDVFHAFNISSIFCRSISSLGGQISYGT